MKNQEWRYIDKSAWPDGPWQEEPDKLQWTDAATGMPCLIVRVHHSGHLCGYVGVTKTHPLHGRNYDWQTFHPKIHGGLTFADKCSGKEHGICHIVEAGEDDDVWWFGFDCAHLGDYCPSQDWRRSDGDSYCTVTYVQAECASLARQLKEVKATMKGAPE